MPFSTVQATDAVAQGDPIVTAHAFDRALVDREDQAVAFFQTDDLRARLHARPLLGQHELTAGEILPRRRQKNRHLEREDMLAIHILMQAVVVLWSVLQQQGCRTLLASGVTTFEEGRKALGKTARQIHLLMPAIGYRHQSPGERAAQA